MARSEYVVAVNVDNAEKLGRMRGHTGVTVFVDNDVIWLKGGTSHEDIDSALKSLPGRHFQLRDASDLIPAGNRLVSQRLSNPHWVPLSDWLKVEVPATAWPRPWTSDPAVVVCGENWRRDFQLTNEARR
jgi:hypothetical protein